MSAAACSTPNFAAVLNDIREADADELERDIAAVECVDEYSDGRGGGRMRLTGRSYDAVLARAQQLVKGCDPWRSPSILSRPVQMPGGSWTAVIGWSGLGD